MQDSITTHRFNCASVVSQQFRCVTFQDISSLKGRTKQRHARKKIKEQKREAMPRAEKNYIHQTTDIPKAGMELWHPLI